MYVCIYIYIVYISLSIYIYIYVYIYIYIIRTHTHTRLGIHPSEQDLAGLSVVCHVSGSGDGTGREGQISYTLIVDTVYNFCVCRDCKQSRHRHM